MALETLLGLTEIGGYKIANMSELEQLIAGVFSDEDTSKIQSAFSNGVFIRHHKNTLSFKIQDGPIKENGLNGCQVDTLIETARVIINGLNKKFPCDENIRCIHHLDAALISLGARKKDREKRNVEGCSHV